MEDSDGVNLCYFPDTTRLIYSLGPIFATICLERRHYFTFLNNIGLATDSCELSYLCPYIFCFCANWQVLESNFFSKFSSSWFFFCSLARIRYEIQERMKIGRIWQHWSRYRKASELM